MTKRTEIVVAGLKFYPVEFDDVETQINRLVKAHGWEYGRFFYLIQDKKDLDYEVKTVNKFRPGMKRVALGNLSVGLLRRYPENALANVNIWVARADDGVTAHHVKMEFFGHWIDTVAQKAQAKRMADRIVNWDKAEVAVYNERWPEHIKFIDSLFPIMQYIP